MTLQQKVSVNPEWPDSAGEVVLWVAGIALAASISWAVGKLWDNYADLRSKHVHYHPEL